MNAKVGIITFGLVFGVLFARAEDQKMPSAECEKVIKACEAAHFQPGYHKKNGMGLWIDCVGKLSKGESVNGVSGISKEEAEKCKKSKKAERAEKKANLETK